MFVYILSAPFYVNMFRIATQNACNIFDTYPLNHSPGFYGVKSYVWICLDYDSSL